MEYSDYGCRRTLKEDLNFWKEIYSDETVLKNMNSAPFIENYKDFWLYINSVERFVVYGFDEGLIGGFSLYERRNKEACFGIVIHPKFRGCGFGSIVMEFLCDTAKDLGVKTLKADVYSDNIASLELLRKNGFRDITYLEKHL